MVMQVRVFDKEFLNIWFSQRMSIELEVRPNPLEMAITQFKQWLVASKSWGGKVENGRCIMTTKKKLRFERIQNTEINSGEDKWGFGQPSRSNHGNQCAKVRKWFKDCDSVLENILSCFAWGRWICDENVWHQRSFSPSPDLENRQPWARSRN